MDSGADDMTQRATQTVVQKLNEQFAINHAVNVVNGEGGLPKVCINNTSGAAEVYLHGAHVTHYQPKNAKPVLWLSERALYQPPAAIRGGVPVCWPWFGSPDTHRGLPAHGFARNHGWKLMTTVEIDAATHAVTLSLIDSPESRKLWPHPFKIELTVTLSDSLQIQLRQTNTDDLPVTVAGALHSYFAVDDISKTSITGLSGTQYLDYVDSRIQKDQSGGITIDQEVDRIYTDTRSDVVINDTGGQRRIRVVKQGSATTVVWNPWVEKTRNLADCVDDAYQRMVCVESVNTLSDSPTLDPGDTHCLIQQISLE